MKQVMGIPPDERVASDLAEVAQRVIRHSLRIGRQQQITLIFDRFGLELAEAFIEAARALRQNLLSVYVPYSVQLDFRALRATANLSATVSSSAAIITAFTDSHETTSFRRNLLDLAVKHKVKCIHMPGVTDDLLIGSALGLDFASLDRRASAVAAKLAHADAVEIHTYSYLTQTVHSLRLRIKGRRGFADGGIAREGHIINIPSGEAYIAPLEGSANGSIVINGSFPERSIPRGLEVLLTFKKGSLQLAECHLPSNGTGEYCRDLLLAALSSDYECVQIGELGLGLNPNIRSATGRTILDEKAFGSAHIALGSNTSFGGRNRAPYHHDLVFYPTKLNLDGVPFQMTGMSRSRDYGKNSQSVETSALEKSP
jgi:leucyl aminopeptidase (aminopeptidase T)